MDRKLMMQYLQTLAQLECQVYTLNQLQLRLDNQRKQLGHACRIKKPKRKKPEKMGMKQLLNCLGSSLLATVVYGIPIYLGAGVVIALLIVLLSLFTEPLYGLENVLEWLLFEGGIPLLIPIGFAAFLIWSEQKEIKDDNNRYEEELAAYEAATAADALRVQKELEVKAVLCAQRDAVLTEYWSAKNALDALYGLDIIKKEYREFAAVTTFYSYFSKEYVDRLLGPRQAYDRYDDALKIGEIINKLDIIINKLDEIARNQAYLVDLLQDSNNTLRRIEQGNKKMLDSMERTEDNIELIEYNTKCAARSSEATAMLTAFEFLRKRDE